MHPLVTQTRHTMGPFTGAGDGPSVTTTSVNFGWADSVIKAGLPGDSTPTREILRKISPATRGIVPRDRAGRRNTHSYHPRGANEHVRNHCQRVYFVHIVVVHEHYVGAVVFWKTFL